MKNLVDHWLVRTSVLAGQAALTLALALASAQAAAQTGNPALPSLGDSSEDSLSPESERRLGEVLMRYIRGAAAGPLDDPELESYLQSLVARLAQHNDSARGLGFELFAIGDASINAFALPGGFIGVHTGLILEAQAESELAAVLAHEIAHVSQRHIARRLEQQRQSRGIAIASLLAAVLAARASPDAMGGLLALGGSVQMQQMLGFSREAEREADRIGLEMLRGAGFDPQAMVTIFGRMQAASRLNERAEQSYFRTHPFTGERMADIQNRVLALRYRQHASSLDFALLRARLSALADRDRFRLQERGVSLRRQLDQGAIEAGPARYALAAIALALDAPAQAREEIGLARAALGERGRHRFIEALAAEIELAAGRPREALQSAQAALVGAPGSRALLRITARALAAGAAEPAQALTFLRTSARSIGTDPVLWEMLAQAESGSGRTGQAHRAMAERYALSSSLPAAVEQLELALKARTLDFYEASEVDVRRRVLMSRFVQENELLKGLR
jgi:predicted Zn-dependent protease